MTRTYEAPAVLATVDVVSATNSAGKPPVEGTIFGVDVTVGFCL